MTAASLIALNISHAVPAPLPPPYDPWGAGELGISIKSGAGTVEIFGHRVLFRAPTGIRFTRVNGVAKVNGMPLAEWNASQGGQEA